METHIPPDVWLRQDPEYLDAAMDLLIEQHEKES